jgi:hypothetical protein
VFRFPRCKRKNSDSHRPTALAPRAPCDTRRSSQDSSPLTG